MPKITVITSSLHAVLAFGYLGWCRQCEVECAVHSRAEHACTHACVRERAAGCDESWMIYLGAMEECLEPRAYFRDPGSERARRGAISDYFDDFDSALLRFPRAYGKRF